MVKFLTELFVMEFVPALVPIPITRPAVVVVALVVPFVNLSMIFPDIVNVPVPALRIPYTVCGLDVEPELA